MLGRVGDRPLPRRAADAAARRPPLHALRRRLRRQRRRPGSRGSASAPRSSRGSATTGTASSCATSSRAEGIDCRFLAVDREWRTPPTFCEIWPPDDFPLTFYRRPTAPDWQLQAGRLRPRPRSPRRRVLFATGTGLAQSPSRETTLAALLGAHGGTSVFDLDWRPSLWDEPARTASSRARPPASPTSWSGTGGGRRRRWARRAARARAGGDPEARRRRGGALRRRRAGRRARAFPSRSSTASAPAMRSAAALGYAIVRGIGLREGVRARQPRRARTSRNGSPCSEAMPTAGRAHARWVWRDEPARARASGTR